MTPYKPEEGDEVLIVKKGLVTHVSDKGFGVDDWFIYLSELHHPDLKITKLL